MMEFLQMAQENWEVILGSAVAAVVGADKFFLVLITTLGNIRDAWRKTFPKNYNIKDEDL